MKVLFVMRYSGDEHNGIMSISSVLKKRGHQSEIVDAEYAKVKSALNPEIPTVLAYSMPTILSEYYLNLNNKLKKEHRVLSVFGGPHPTAVPEIIGRNGVDGVCIGEGEFAMAELMDSLDAGKPIRDVRNWWIKEDGVVYKNALRPLVEDLDSLPLPDRGIFKNQSLFDREKMHLITGRGCPYSCSYCCHSFYNRLYNDQAAKIRKRSIKSVIEEIIRFKREFPLKFVVFDDDVFILPRNWLKEFCQEYKKYIGLPFFCYLRADLVDERTIQYLKSAGCFSVSMGIETADDHLRSHIYKRNMSRLQIIEAAKLIKAHKIRLKASNIIGAPGSFIDTDLETLRLNIMCKTDYSSVEMLMPYPETDICSLFGANTKNNHSALNLENKYSRRQLINLRNLFAIIIEFPVLFYLARFLIKLPLGYLYKFCNLIWEGYCACFRLYPASWMSFKRGIKKYVYKISEELLENRGFFART